MGRPVNTQGKLRLRGAAPREVYFLARTLFRKADRLSAERTHEHGAELDTPEGEITAADVLEVIDQAQRRVDRVLQRIDPDATLPPSAPRTAADYDQLSQEIVQANRQLNLLLDRRFSPNDVYENVTTGISYAARLLAEFPGAQRVLAPPEFESRKRPANVYRRLIECFGRIRIISEASGVQTMTLDVDEEAIDRATPSDVYDIASILVAELADLHRRLPDSHPPRRVVYPGQKLPSHVFQRVGLLEKQLVELEKLVQQHPQWLHHDNSQ
ncbi:hypothetical protein Pan216_36440 [Planctomycetes bacterium Pan216]|uniref:Uncharacterized protein n=2 Tax=Kolteria novifilia TaxID=2527975 RepID=A0A518B719_9BACT|nr:hypothetical protein Pan216_36440 [Planctomycetes bacterium Pan216]